MSSIRELREAAGMTQKEAADLLDIPVTTYGSYERGERSTTYERGVWIREKLAEAAGGNYLGDGEKNLVRVEVYPAGAGRGQDLNGSESLVFDRSLFRGTDVAPDRHIFLRVVGAGMEPLISHGQVAAVDPIDKVHSHDLYVYWCSQAQAHVVAILSPYPGGLELKQRGPSPTEERLEHIEGTTYEDPQGRRSDLEVRGRVVGAICNPSRNLAARREAARNARVAA